jgi:aspartate aminotransferase-like enzyme/GNAT superfamily N-acetyltransferase
MSLQVKIADRPDEFDQIACFNYATFVEEIPQHTENPDKALIDKFHRENRYFICKDGGMVVGMVAIRDRRPFSLDAKIPNLDDYVLPGESLCEIRLLAIRPDRRHGRILELLMREIFAYAIAKGFDRGLISGRLKNIPLYEKLGFRSFGVEVGAANARYQPMAITRETMHRGLSRDRRIGRDEASDHAQHFFSPGPVGLSLEVKQAIQIPLYSHRSSRYAGQLRRAKEGLLKLTKAQSVEILLGTGTLANDVVAGHIADLQRPGLILVNGEFGERLVRHAESIGLEFRILSWAWGETMDKEALRETLLAYPAIGWLWCVHCETSTGQVAPIADIQRICDDHGVFTHWDGISSLGVIPCDWSRARMATAVSGKAIGALTGMAMVFYRHECLRPDSRPNPARPRYLDITQYSGNQGIPFSGSSLGRDDGNRADQRREFSEWLIPRLAASGLPLVVAGEDRSPGIITVALPEALSSQALGEELENAGIFCNYAGTYLIKRNWLQIRFMGEMSLAGLERLWSALERRVAALAPLA